jgi:L-asparaginase II
MQLPTPALAKSGGFVVGRLPMRLPGATSWAMSDANPVLIEVTRGGRVESQHRGAAAIVDKTGAIIGAWGDIARPVYPRSSVKPLQALQLIETGAADRFRLSDAEIALAAASHHGTAEHVRRVTAWLERIGLGIGDLACGIHPPIDRAADEALIREGRAPSAAHNNCSGKHTGFLTGAVHMGEPTVDYRAPDHPVQRRVREIFAAMGDAEPYLENPAVDGCGVPTWAIPLKALATMGARLADPGGLTPTRANAARRVVAAMTANPVLVGGPMAFDTKAIAAARGAFVTKAGAEGVEFAAIPRLGLGIALKIDDGALRGCTAAMATLLDHIGALDDDARAALGDYLRRDLINPTGTRVGEIRPAPGWPG